MSSHKQRHTTVPAVCTAHPLIHQSMRRALEALLIPVTVAAAAVLRGPGRCWLWVC